MRMQSDGTAEKRAEKAKSGLAELAGKWHRLNTCKNYSQKGVLE